MGLSDGTFAFESSFLKAARQQLIVQAGKHSEAQPPGQRGVLIDGRVATKRDGVGDVSVRPQHRKGHDGPQSRRQTDGQSRLVRVGSLAKKLLYDCLALSGATGCCDSFLEVTSPL